MKHATTLFAILLSLSAAAQQWAPIGATWHYPWSIQGFPGTNGYHRFESVLDTVINGQSTRKIVLSGSPSYGGVLTHDVDGVVFIYVPSTEAFDTLFNFNAVPGDRWSYVPLPLPLACTDESWVEVVDTGSTMIDDVSLRWLAVDNHNITEDGEYVEPDTIIERLGPKHSFMLPHEQCNTAVSPGVIGGLLCYADTDIDYMRPGITDCTLGMGVISRSGPIDLELFPNPGTEGFNLILPIGTQGMITVYDARGAIGLGPISISGPAHVDATTWPTGLYAVRLTPPIGLPSAVQWVKW